MEERLRFIAALKEGRLAMSEACELYRVSRKTGYKWLERFEKNGPSGLEDRSRAPRTTPHALEAELAEELVEVRRRHPTWGPKKVLAWLLLRQPGRPLPAASTVGALFGRRGLVTSSRRRRRLKNLGPGPLGHLKAANEGWCADFKGHFKVGDGRRCDPLTVTDAYSRYLLCCQAVEQPTTEYVWPLFERTFREYGLPGAIRSDNGPPFASRALGGLSRLSVRWVRLGIRLERIKPGKPQQNGRHERMHRTLKAETVRPAAANLGRQQERFDEFREEFNHDRPHEALDGQPPGRLYTSSPRPYPEKLPQVEYPAHLYVRMVRTDGTIQWRARNVYISEALIGEPVGLEEVDDGKWLLRFGPMALGVLDETLSTPKIIAGPIP